MKFSTGGLIAVAALAFTTGLVAQTEQAPKPVTPVNLLGMELTTTAFEDGGVIPDKYTSAAYPGIPSQKAKHISPPLKWSRVPEGTVSFVLRFHDPDAVVNGRMEEIHHWLMFNIPGGTRELAEGVPPLPQFPDGSIQLPNFGKMIGYLNPGASPNAPYHHYTFSIFALDTKLNLGPDATEADVENAMQGHILAKGVLVGRFHRP